MCDYNIQDVILLEKVYLEMLPYMKTHPNTALWGNITGCPNCGSDNTQKRGFIRSKGITGLILKQRYQCQDCGAWYQGEKV